jgi:hypothetical protein
MSEATHLNLIWQDSRAQGSDYEDYRILGCHSEGCQIVTSILEEYSVSTFMILYRSNTVPQNIYNDLPRMRRRKPEK